MPYLVGLDICFVIPAAVFIIDIRREKIAFL